VCSRYESVWHIMNVAVDPDDRRVGVARALLGELLARVDDEAARFTLEVRRSNAPAIALYERFGFRSAGMRRRYYQDNGEDALIMWRTPATLEGSLGDIPAAGPGTPTPHP
jgi:ribosomal-protein-alanine N-acetyltransferase